MATILINIIVVAANLISLLILARVLLSWVQVDRYHPVVKFLYDVTEPILAPVRNLMPQVGMMDFSPIIVFFLIQVIEQVLVYVISSLFRY